MEKISVEEVLCAVNSVLGELSQKKPGKDARVERKSDTGSRFIP
jgi:hypothetical protein